MRDRASLHHRGGAEAAKTSRERPDAALAWSSPSGAMIQTRRGPLVLLFYDGYEKQAREGVVGQLHSRGREIARHVYRRLKRQQVWTGFYTAFMSLHRSLVLNGCDVRVNDFRTARRYPGYPIGIAGFPSVLGRVASLPNPRIFGPGDYGYPNEAREVAKDARIRLFIQPCDWYVEFYREACGDRLLKWPVGIDTAYWRDMSRAPKTTDLIIYDKLRWYREREVPRILDRVIRHVEARGLSYTVLRYGGHVRRDFERAIETSRAMIFLCEHETQGLAYLEAMACNMPVLAWDEERLVDPLQTPFVGPGFKVSAVPYHDERCGLKFRIDQFEPVFDRFWAERARYTPRAYVEETLSMRDAGAAYLQAYRSLIPPG
jgi:hypothetical protein